MQIAEVTGVLEGEDAPCAVFFPFVRAGCSGEEKAQLRRVIVFTNDVVVRGDDYTTTDGLENVQVARAARLGFSV